MIRTQSVQIFSLVPAAVARASGRAAPGEPWHIQACPLGARPARMAAGPVVTSTPVVGSGCRGGARAPPAAPHPAHPGVDSRFALVAAQSAPPMQPNGVGPSARAVPARPHGARETKLPATIKVPRAPGLPAIDLGFLHPSSLGKNAGPVKKKSLLWGVLLRGSSTPRAPRCTRGGASGRAVGTLDAQAVQRHVEARP